MAIQSFEEILLERLAKLENEFNDLRGADKPGSNPIGVNQIVFGNANQKPATEPLLFWDSATKRLGIGTNAPSAPVHVSPASGNIFALFGTGATGSGDNTYLWIDRTSATGGAINIDALRSGVGGATLRLNKLNNGPVEIAQTAYINMTLLNGWSNIGAPWATAQYAKDPNGYVHMRGLIAGGTTANGTILCNLPAGYRPGANTMFPTISNNAFAAFDVGPNGDVTIRIGASAVWFGLFTGHFLAEN